MVRQGKGKKQKAGLNRSILSVGFATIGIMFADKEVEEGGFYLESTHSQTQAHSTLFQVLGVDALDSQ